MTDENRQTTRVLCSIVNGVELRLFERSFDADGMGTLHMVPVGDAVVLKGPSAITAGVGSAGTGELVATDVDAAWFSQWLAQNEQNPLVLNGAIRYQDDPK